MAKPLLAGVVGLVALVSGCGGSEPAAPAAAPTSAAPTPTAAATGPAYTQPASLCEAADLRPLTELYPKQPSKPIGDGPSMCMTRLESTADGLQVRINAIWMKRVRDGALAYGNLRREEAYRNYTDISGAGGAAGWARTDDGLRLLTYDGNVVLTIDVTHIDKARPLPTDLPPRLARVAASVFANLSP
ncbi:hypothetical protein WEI85_09915 [Actinomycetes bacterium KLBMP 9797]